MCPRLPFAGQESSDAGSAALLLVSDLDGTLIAPVPAEREVVEALDRFRDLVLGNANVVLAYATGRDYALALDGVRTFGLPFPDAILSDVGTRVLHRVRGTERYEDDRTYSSRLEEVFGRHERSRIDDAVAAVPGVVRQEEAKQGPFKVSFYVDAGIRDDEILSRVNSSLGTGRDRTRVVLSRDPADARGLLDVLPRMASKASAARHLSTRFGLPDASVVYFGDSGNDTDALLSGFYAVLVGNAPDSLRSFLRERAAGLGIEDRLYFARSPYAAGVIEGCRHFDVL